MRNLKTIFGLVTAGFLLGHIQAKAQAIEVWHDNDVMRFNKTDHLYTAGIGLNWFLAPKNQHQYSFLLDYKMYTPYEFEHPDTVVFNQPNTAYVVLGVNKQVYS